MVDTRVPNCFDFILMEHKTCILRDKKADKILFWFELAMTEIVVVEARKQTRCSFTREFKLSAVE